MILSTHQLVFRTCRDRTTLFDMTLLSHFHHCECALTVSSSNKQMTICAMLAVGYARLPFCKESIVPNCEFLLEVVNFYPPMER